MRKNLFLLGVIFSSILYADEQIAPDSYTISNNGTISVDISNTDMNRVVVKNDKITHIVCPQNYCSVQSYPKDPSGSAILSVQGVSPFSAYIYTAEGHQFSVFLHPKGIPGITAVFNTTGNNKVAQRWEESSGYQKMLLELIKGMMNNQAPDGYSDTDVSTQYKMSNDKVFNWYLTKIFMGDHVNGLVYKIVNHTNKTKTLNPRAFYNATVRAVAVSKQEIKPLEAAYVYEVVNNG